jgi:lipopolysaccharide export system permease protein
MKILDSHIRNTVFMAMLVVLSLVSAMELIFSLADELGRTRGDYSAINALTFVLFTMPATLYELLPYVALGGALIGLGVLASNNELIVMQAAGIRVWRIVWAVLKPTILIMFIGLMVGEYISPPLEQSAQSNKAIKRSGRSSINSESGTWHKVGQEYIHINAIAPGGKLLYGVTRYRLGENRQIDSSSFAESARYIEQGDESFWQLDNISESIFSTANIAVRQYLQEDWRVDLSPVLLTVLLVEPDRLSISGLRRIARFYADEGLDSATYFLAFWKKLLQPLATLSLVMLAISFVFGPLRESTTGFRVFVSLGIGLGFSIMQRIMEPVSLLYGFSPLLAVLAPIFLTAGLGLYFIRRVH